MNVKASRNVIIEDADIKDVIFRNFSGKPDKFHASGTIGNFTLILSDEKGRELLDRGFAVKIREDRDGNEEYRLRVFVRFDHVPPKVFQVSGTHVTELNEETIECLDNAELSKVEVVLNPYHYDVSGTSGIKAYLSRGYFTIREDILASRYANLGADGDGDDGPLLPWEG